jgi:carboxypeptidase C (cathepsin A)
VAFVAGTRSHEVRQVGLAASQRVTQGRISWMEGSHLFPFERPEETVREVLDWMQRLDAVTAVKE